jgi:pyrimidine deaminase RibD-like protein
MGFSSPNPPVACVITDLNDNILSSAHTQKTGFNHAEREAYLKLGENFSEKHNLYVTLEPCSHFGRTPPCLDLLLKYKPQKVFLGIKDPNPLVKKTNSISILKENNDADTAMFYVSDHGQSLGEDGIYLHGMPYLVAPKHQKHIPMIIWLSENFTMDFGIDKGCVSKQVEKEFSHDNLFHSILDFSAQIVEL